MSPSKIGQLEAASLVRIIFTSLNPVINQLILRKSQVSDTYRSCETVHTEKDF